MNSQLNRDELTAFLVIDNNENRRVGYKNKDNILCIPPIYYIRLKLPNEKIVFNHDCDFQNGLAVVMNEEGKFGMIDKKGGIVIDLQYEAISNVIVNNIIFYRKGSVCGFMKTDGCIVSEYTNCISIRQKEEHIYIVYYNDGAEKEINLLDI